MRRLVVQGANIMRAAFVRQFGGIENLFVETAPDPSPGAGEVVVDIAAAAVNYVDLVMISGQYQFLPQLPFIPGKLPVGTISAVGAKVDGWKTGDRVVALAEFGGYASKIAIPAAGCVRLPDSVSFAPAAAMALAYDTAWFAINERARAKTGETLLVLGATGAVGLAAVQLGKVYGLRVLAAVANPAKRDLAVEAGADAVIDVGAADLRDSLRRQVYAETGGRGADVVLDPLGDKFFDAAIRAVAWCGRLVVIGFAAGNIPSVKANYLLVKNIEVTGLQISDYRVRTPELMRHCYAEIFRLYEAGKLRPPPITTFPLERAKDALRLLRDRKATGRLVLVPSDTE